MCVHCGFWLEVVVLRVMNGGVPARALLLYLAAGITLGGGASFLPHVHSVIYGSVHSSDAQFSQWAIIHTCIISFLSFFFF